MEDFNTICYEQVSPKIASITLNRPQQRNAQNSALLYELNQAFDLAARDDGIHVVILKAQGPHFSAGHDLAEEDRLASMAAFEPVGTWCGFGCAGAEGQMAVEKELYLGLSERWRNFPKPTIAQVHGKCISGGLMLIWPCDLIVASEDAQFMDNTVNMGIAGAEFFNHPYELGVRKAKEFLFTADFIDAREAWRLGMVNHVVAADSLHEFTLELARKIAIKPLFTLKLLKESLNSAQDNQGRRSTMATSFANHQLSHSHNMELFGLRADPSFLRESGFANKNPRFAAAKALKD